MKLIVPVLALSLLGCQKESNPDKAESKPAPAKPAAEKPAAEKPAAEKPAAEKPTAEKPTAEKPAAPEATTLKAELEAKKAAFLEKAPAERAAIYDRGVDTVARGEVMKSAKKVGDKAPDFTLPDATGKSVTLSTLLKDGPVVLTWYRGGWCPYCNIQLRFLQKKLPEFKKAGATLVAVSPEKPDNSLDTTQKNKLEFTVLSDTEQAVADAWGLRYTLPEEVQAAFEGRLDVAGANADGTNRLPLAATYVIAKDGTIAWAFVDPDYRKRAEPAEILAALEKL